jgi:hypothetical protein
MIGTITLIVLSGYISYAEARVQFDTAVQQQMPCMYYNEQIQQLLRSRKPAVTMKRLEREHPADREIRKLKRLAKLTGYI